MNDFKNLFSWNKEPLILSVKIKTSAWENKIIEKREDGTWKIAIKAPRENGKANLELIQFLSKISWIKKENIEIISGNSQEYKKIVFNPNK